MILIIVIRNDNEIPFAFISTKRT